jgi:hypothetical protein
LGEKFDMWGSVLRLEGMTNNNIKKHRLSGGFDPKAYRFVELFDHRHLYGEPVDPLPIELQIAVEANGYSLNHCTHCGAALKSGAVYQHDSGEHIIIGTTCSDRLDFESASEIHAAHKANRIYLAGLRKAMRRSWRWKPVVRFLEAARDDESLGSWERSIAEDMLRKLSRYFSLSRKQIAFVHRIVREYPEKEAKRKAREEEEAARKAMAPDWESGRYPIEGTILNLKDVESDWGWSTKCLIQLEDGRRCWGTVPSSLDVDTGDAIAITATFSPSRDDSSFAFFKRPTTKGAA